MTDAEWITLTATVISIAFGIPATVAAWRNRRIRDLESDIDNLKRSMRRLRSERDSAWAYMEWIRREHKGASGSDLPPLPLIPHSESDDEE